MENNFAEIHIFDVGFGESIYVKVTKSDNSETSYLIDTGYAKNKDKFKRMLKYKNIVTIDNLILTHKHSDHISFAKYWLENFESIGLKNIFLDLRDLEYCSETSKKLSESLLNLQGEKRLNVFDIRDDRAINALMDFKVLYPIKGSMRINDDENRNSIVLLLCVGKYGVLFTGDATIKEENIFLEEIKKKKHKICVLKVGHHGSKGSTGEELIRYIKDDIQYAFVSADVNRRYNLPSKCFEQRWKLLTKKNASDLYYTEYKFDGSKQDLFFTVDKDRGCELVDPASISFFGANHR